MTPEQIAETEMYARLENTLLEALTALSSEDLKAWGIRSAIFTNPLDGYLDAIIEASRGRENVARHHLSLLAFKIVNRLLGKLDVGLTDGALARQTEARYKAIAAKPKAKKAAPRKARLKLAGG